MKLRILLFTLLLGILHPLYCSLSIEIKSHGIDLGYTSSEQKSYQLYESDDLIEWQSVGSKHRGNGEYIAIALERNASKKFYRLETEDVFSDIVINRDLADQILGDGLLVEPGIYQPATTSGDFSLRGSSDGIEIITEGTWSWSVSDDDFNVVVLVATITRYRIPDFGFDGSPQSFANTFGQPAPVAEEAVITYTNSNTGYIDSEILLTNNSTEQEPREYF